MPRSHSLSIALVGLLLVFVVAACSGSSDDDEATTTEASGGSADATSTGAATVSGGGGGGGEDIVIEACGLLTQDEIGAALDGTVGPGVEQTPIGTFFGCKYEDAEGFPAASITVLVYPDADEALAEFDNVIARPGAEEIEDLGDRAYTAEIYDVTALHDRIELTVELVPQTDAQLTEGMVERSIVLTRIALGRLP